MSETRVISHKYQLLRGESGYFNEDELLLELAEPFVEYTADEEGNKSIVGIKIGDGKTPYSGLPFLHEEAKKAFESLIEEIDELKDKISNSGDYTYFTTDDKWENYHCEDLQQKINHFINLKNSAYTPIIGNLFVIKQSLYEGSNNNIYQIYVYTQEGWTELVSSNTNADNVIFTDDIVYTEPIGHLTVPKKGNDVIRARGKSLSEVLNYIFCKERDPQITMPAVSLQTYNLDSVVVGTRVKPSYEVNLFSGSYEFGPPTRAVISDVTVTLTDGNKDLEVLSDTEGQFSPIVVEDNHTYYIKASGTVNIPNKPTTNLGNPIQISDTMEFNLRSDNLLSGYTPILYGYKDASQAVSIENMTGDELSQYGLNSSKSLPQTIKTNQMKQLIVAIPVDRDISTVTIANSVTSVPQHVRYHRIDSVPLKDSILHSDYIVFYVENTNADRQSNTYKITYS